MAGTVIALAGACATTSTPRMSAFLAAYRAASPTGPIPEITKLHDGKYSITSYGVRSLPIDAKELETRTARLNAKAKGNR